MKAFSTQASDDSEFMTGQTVGFDIITVFSFAFITDQLLTSYSLPILASYIVDPMRWWYPVRFFPFKRIAATILTPIAL